MANATAKLTPIRVIKPESRWKPGISATSTFWRSSTSVTTMDTVGNRYTTALTSNRLVEVKKTA